MTYSNINIHFRAVYCLVYSRGQTLVEVCVALSPAHFIDGGEAFGLHQLKVCSSPGAVLSLFFPPFHVLCTSGAPSAVCCSFPPPALLMTAGLTKRSMFCRHTVGTGDTAGGGIAEKVIDVMI